MDSLQMDRDDITNRRESYRPDFSFNNQSSDDVSSKYFSLSKELKKLEQEDLIEFLLEEIQQNQKAKQQLSVCRLTIMKYQEQLKEFQIQLSKKRQAISALCESQSKNISIIEKLERRLFQPIDIDNQSYFQQKYRQLQKYMSQYINNINEAQSQFTKNYNLLKNENKRTYAQFQKVNKQAIHFQKQNEVLIHQLSKTERKMSQLREDCKILTNELEGLLQENQAIKKELQINNENIKITDRIQFRSDNHTSSELDFIRQKLNENQLISEDLDENQQERLYKYSKKNSEKILIQSNSHQKSKFFDQRVTEIQIQNENLKKKLLFYQNQLQILQKQLNEKSKILTLTKQELQQMTLSKQSIQGQLLQLTGQLKNMEKIFQRQSQQTQKIKEQLNTFWMTKEIKHKSEKNNTLKQNNTTRVSCDSFANSMYDQLNYQKSQKLQYKQNQYND